MFMNARKNVLDCQYISHYIAFKRIGLFSSRIGGWTPKYQWLGKRKIKQKHRKTEIIKTQNVSVISIEKTPVFYYG